MVAGRPWYHAYPADFFTATQGWPLEMKGPYRLIIDLLNERDRPIPDDAKFMAGILGCSPQRWRKVRDFLIDHRKLVPTQDGQHLTNPRFERERAARLGDHEASVAWGRAGGLERARRAGQLDMDLDAGWHDDEQDAPSAPAHARARSGPESKENRKTFEKESQNFRESSSSDRRKPKQKPNEINARSQPPPQAPCAREESRDQSPEDSSHPIRTATDSRARPIALDDMDLPDLVEAVCDAAGHQPRNPEQRDRATRHVAQWRDQGVSFDQIVVPTIRAVISRTDQPTRTLGRFKADIAHAHARSIAGGGRAAPEPPRQLTASDANDRRIGPLRDRLRKEVGVRTYDGWLRPTAMSLNGETLTVLTPSPFMADWIRSHFGDLLARAAAVERVDVRPEV